MSLMDQIELVLRGEFGRLLDLKVKLIPKTKVSLLISSTFTDTFLERNILQEQILPLLQDKGREDGIDVVFTDLRFGLRGK